MAIANRGSERLRRLLAEKSTCICAPGVYDGITARLAISQGFECLYMTGAGTSMSRLGMADLGLCTQSDMITNASAIAAISPDTPVIADADTGYGGPIMVARTVEAYARAGVAALHLEDQVQEKRCGHILGKQLVEPEVWYSKIRAAVKARDDMESDMVIIARTDARASLGMEEALARLTKAAELGADVLFLEAMQSQDECRYACEALRFLDRYMLLNMVPGGTTPEMTTKEATQLGFKLVIFPTLLLEAMISGGNRALECLKRTGCQPAGAVGPRKMFALCGLEDLMEIDRIAGGQAYDAT